METLKLTYLWILRVFKTRFGKHINIRRPPDGGFLILYQKGKVVMIREGFHKNRWGLPGGGFVFGKNANLFSTAADETHEETGCFPLTAEETQLLFMTTKKRKEGYNHNMFFLCKKFGFNHHWIPDGIEVREVRSFTFAEIFSPSMQLTDGSRRILTLLYYYLHDEIRFRQIIQNIGGCETSGIFHFNIDEDSKPIPPPLRIV